MVTDFDLAGCYEARQFLSIGEARVNVKDISSDNRFRIGILHNIVKQFDSNKKKKRRRIGVLYFGPKHLLKLATS